MILNKNHISKAWHRHFVKTFIVNNENFDDIIYPENDNETDGMENHRQTQERR